MGLLHFIILSFRKDFGIFSFMNMGVGDGSTGY